MGQGPSLEDELVNLRLTSKQMARSAEKSRKNEAAMKLKLKKAIEAGNTEGARIYAQNAIREKSQQQNFLRLSSRIDAVSARVETAVRMQQVSQSMNSVVKGMGRAMKSMNLEKISKTMVSNQDLRLAPPSTLNPQP
uniref:Charged multivesicular body protein 1a n=1 Tax=Phaeomonas parva TaxID=124430 RepID=A0A7S1TZG6_9STRA|mmetsp:Transcript_25047/g.78530  ORF Transcript_25047/g.78530 Transcript_25047/m.78530 type:complete len:137 (+) Transcript_25047:227-637(+)